MDGARGPGAGSGPEGGGPGGAGGDGGPGGVPGAGAALPAALGPQGGPRGRAAGRGRGGRGRPMRTSRHRAAFPRPGGIPCPPFAQPGHSGRLSRHPADYFATRRHAGRKGTPTRRGGGGCPFSRILVPLASPCIQAKPRGNLPSDAQEVLAHLGDLQSPKRRALHGPVELNIPL